MTFFDYSIYDIPSRADKSSIKLQSDLIILVEDDAFANEDHELLTKILASVNQDINNAQVVRLKKDTVVDLIQDDEANRLVIIFGMPPQQCGLQIDQQLYHSMNLSNTTYLFSSTLNLLPQEKDERRALWNALKNYFKMD